VNLQDSMLGIRPLTLAAESGDHGEMVKLLLEKGAGVNERSSDGNTPLLHAARKGRAGIVRILAGKGADINAKDNRATPP